MPELLAIGPVSVAQQKPWRRVPGKRIAELLGRPRRRRVPRHVDMENLASVMGQYDEHEQHSKCERRDDEEIDRDELAHMIRQERTPGLGRRGRRRTM